MLLGPKLSRWCTTWGPGLIMKIHKTLYFCNFVTAPNTPKGCKFVNLYNFMIIIAICFLSLSLSISKCMHVEMLGCQPILLNCDRPKKGKSLPCSIIQKPEQRRQGNPCGVQAREAILLVTQNIEKGVQESVLFTLNHTV